MRGIISVCLDDARNNQFTEALPILNSYKIPATIFTVSSFIDTPFYMTADELVKAKESGNEIGVHSINHVDLTTLNREEIINEVVQSKIIIESIVGSVSGFATPYGAFNNITTDIIMQHFSYCRNVERGYNTKLFDISNIEIQGYSEGEDISNIKRHILLTRKMRTWLVLAFHNVGLGFNDDWACDLDTFINIAKLIKRSKLIPLTMSDAIKKYI